MTIWKITLGIKVKDKHSQCNDVLSKTQKLDSSAETDDGFRDESSAYDGDCEGEGENPQAHDRLAVVSEKSHVDCANFYTTIYQ